MDRNLKEILADFVDFLLPELTPYETTAYLLLFRMSMLESNTLEIRIGKRTLADFYGKGSRGEKPNYAHISKVVKGLEAKGCVKIGDTSREGTLYSILLPMDIPIVAKKTMMTKAVMEEDFFTKPEKRREVFDRDNWTCCYCGEKVTPNNSTLDHYNPQHLGGNHSKENLKTSCLICNSIKSGKTYEEAIPFLLKSIQERRKRNNL